MNSEYLRKQIERQSDLLKKRWNGEEGDPDVWNIEPEAEAFILPTQQEAQELSAERTPKN